MPNRAFGGTVLRVAHALTRLLLTPAGTAGQRPGPSVAPVPPGGVNWAVMGVRVGGVGERE